MIRVLIADDAPVALRNMRRLVTAQDDMEVVGTAADGPATVSTGLDVSPDVLVVDVDLPGVDGLSAARLVRRQVAGCRVVAMGLDDDEAVVDEMRSRGADAYLVKPFAGDELVQAIRAVVTAPEAAAAEPAAATTERQASPDAVTPARATPVSRAADPKPAAAAAPPAPEPVAEPTAAEPVTAHERPAEPRAVERSVEQPAAHEPAAEGAAGEPPSETATTPRAARHAPGSMFDLTPRTAEPEPAAGDPGTAADRLPSPPPLFFGSPPPATPAPQSPAAEQAPWSPFGPLTPSPESPRPAPAGPERAAEPEAVTPAGAEVSPMPMPTAAEAVPAYTTTSLGESDGDLPPLRDRAGPGRVIAFTAGKGGVGTTVLAVNFAILVARETSRPVVVVDLELQHGDVATLLRIDPADEVLTIGDLTRLGRTGDVQGIAAALATTPHGVRVLPAYAGAAVSPAQVHDILGALRQVAAYVVVDVPRHVGAAQAAALREADDVVVVSGMSDPAVRSTQRVIAGVAALGGRCREPVVVLNRSEANSDFTRETVEEALGREVAVQMPYDAIVIGTSVNRGTPFVVGHRESPATRRLRQLARGLVPEMPAASEQAGERDEPEEAPRRARQRRGLFGFARA